MARILDTWSALRRYDAQRRSFPGEHWLTAAAGTWLLRSASRRTSVLARTLAVAGGALLLVRAASGRDGIRRLAPDEPIERLAP